MHAGDQCSGVTCRTECQLEVTAGDHAGDGENCPGLLSTRGDGVLVTLNPIGGPVGRTAVREVRTYDIRLRGEKCKSCTKKSYGRAIFFAVNACKFFFAVSRVNYKKKLKIFLQ